MFLIVIIEMFDKILIFKCMQHVIIFNGNNFIKNDINEYSQWLFFLVLVHLHQIQILV